LLLGDVELRTNPLAVLQDLELPRVRAEVELRLGELNVLVAPRGEALDVLGIANHRRQVRVVRDGLRVELRVLLLERLEHAHADGQAELEHREQAALSEPDVRLDALELAVHDGEHLAVVRAEEDDVVDGAARRGLALFDALDIEAFACRLVHRVQPVDDLGAGLDDGVEEGGAVRV